MTDLPAAVDVLLRAPRIVLPPPAVRGRLRKAHGLTQAQLAEALEVKRLAVTRWESGEAEPRGRRREAYARLLAELSALYPAALVASADQSAQMPR